MNFSNYSATLASLAEKRRDGSFAGKARKRTTFPYSASVEIG
ncbi:MAG: hypothetical protein U5L45_12495 [Saprospiraceae bacterium]|nr:hypothetical protein [Saprospiraceae bacterium]